MAVTAEDLRDALSKKELAALLNISYRSVDRLIHEKKIEVTYVGAGRGRPRFTQRAITAYLTKNTDRVVDPKLPKRGAA